MTQGLKPIFFDEKHKKWREWQRNYDRTISKIRRENNKCSYKEAQIILRKRRLEEKIKEFEREEMTPQNPKLRSNQENGTTIPEGNPRSLIAEN